MYQQLLDGQLPPDLPNLLRTRILCSQFEQIKGFQLSSFRCYDFTLWQWKRNFEQIDTQIDTQIPTLLFSDYKNDVYIGIVTYEIDSAFPKLSHAIKQQNSDFTQWVAVRPFVFYERSYEIYTLIEDPIEQATRTNNLRNILININIEGGYLNQLSDYVSEFKIIDKITEDFIRHISPENVAMVANYARERNKTIMINKEFHRRRTLETQAANANYIRGVRLREAKAASENTRRQREDDFMAASNDVDAISRYRELELNNFDHMPYSGEAKKQFDYLFDHAENYAKRRKGLLPKLSKTRKNRELNKEEYFSHDNVKGWIGRKKQNAVSKKIAAELRAERKQMTILPRTTEMQERDTIRRLEEREDWNKKQSLFAADTAYVADFVAPSAVSKATRKRSSLNYDSEGNSAKRQRGGIRRRRRRRQ